MNLDSRAFCEVEGSRFKRMFVAYGAALNGFILGCRKMLFVDGMHPVSYTHLTLPTNREV